MNYDPHTYWVERAERQGYSYVAKGGSPVEYDAQYRLIAPTLQRLVPECGALLDFGCGPGRFADVLSHKTDLYVGVDIVADALQRAHRTSERWFVLIDERSLPFDDASFDVVVAVTVLQHIVAPDAFEAWGHELGRVLAPGGRMVVWDHYSVEGMDDHMRPRGPEAIAHAAGVGSFDIEEGDADHWVGVAEKR